MVALCGVYVSGTNGVEVFLSSTLSFPVTADSRIFTTDWNWISQETKLVKNVTETKALLCNSLDSGECAQFSWWFFWCKINFHSLQSRAVLMAIRNMGVEVEVSVAECGGNGGEVERRKVKQIFIIIIVQSFPRHSTSIYSIFLLHSFIPFSLSCLNILQVEETGELKGRKFSITKKEEKSKTWKITWMMSFWIFTVFDFHLECNLMSFPSFAVTTLLRRLAVQWMSAAAARYHVECERCH